MKAAVEALVKTYGRNPAALAKALEGFIETQIEKRGARSSAEIAKATCSRLHEGLSDQVTCKGCYDAALERLNGE